MPMSCNSTRTRSRHCARRRASREEAAVGQRGAAIDQRGTAVDQRGADHVEGRNAVDERGAADHQRELQTKLDDLALAQSDMQNLLNSIEIAILFLDQDLNVRRYTERASKIISLRESDVGRPLSDLTTAASEAA
jgi:hypothetical protein